jgi:peptidylprolyl isomerase
MKRLVALTGFCVGLSMLLFVGCNITKNRDNATKGWRKNMVTKTNSGLEYEIVQEGTGATPQKGQAVTVHYTGWLDNNGELGTKFDSSVDRGQPFTFNIGLGQVIKGWDEGVMSMKVGEKRRLMIPANLGYGAYGAGRVIPPHAKLIFDVELLKIG